jgi:hypothetical protein
MSSQPNPHVRPDHGPEIYKEKMVGQITEIFRTCLYSSKVYRSCLTCQHFIEHMEICNLIQGPNNRPNARIIAYGCDAHSEEIPF